MDIRLLDPNDSGMFLHFPHVMEGRILANGSINFKLWTDEGVFQVNSGRTTFQDGETHKFAVGYDDTEGKLSMVIDEIVVATTDASGVTAPGTWHGLTVGTNWHDGVEAIVDDVYFGTEPAVAGVDLSLGPQERVETDYPDPFDALLSTSVAVEDTAFESDLEQDGFEDELPLAS
jgi:hypothetical protein